MSFDLAEMYPTLSGLASPSQTPRASPPSRPSATSNTCFVTKQLQNAYSTFIAALRSRVLSDICDAKGRSSAVRLKSGFLLSPRELESEWALGWQESHAAKYVSSRRNVESSIYFSNLDVWSIVTFICNCPNQIS
jgi:hypothetical protein